MQFKQLFRFRYLIFFMAFSGIIFSCGKDPSADNQPPVADFDVDPAFGNNNQTFTFDASESSDPEDSIIHLVFRWDFEGDSVWDTDYSSSTTASHKFGVGGTFKPRLEVKDRDGASSIVDRTILVSWNNYPPVAKISVNPESGYANTKFSFDAGASWDKESLEDLLVYRWDFENDGNWDVDYTSETTCEHTFNASGEYTVVLEVKDPSNMVGSTSVIVSVSPENQAPEVPGNPEPSDNRMNQSTKVFLRWTCEDPEQDELLFDVYFGTSEQPSLIAEDISEYEYRTLPLEYNTKYYWKIVASDAVDNIVESPVWSFTTNSSINEMGTMTDPRDGKTYKTVTIGEQTWFAENINIGTPKMYEGPSSYQTDNGVIEKFCYDNDPKNCEIYGGLYQWNEAMAYSTSDKARGICPPGWHIPSDAEWDTLITNNGAEQAANHLGLGGTSGFQALYGGYLYFVEGRYEYMSQVGIFWSSTMYTNILSYGRGIFEGFDDMHQDFFGKTYAYSVRCIRDY